MTVNEEIDVKGKSSYIPDTMKAAYLKQVKEVEVEKIKVPSVSGKEVLVKMMAVGICGSDTHYFNHGSIGKRTVQFPHIQGHECAGEIVAIGEEVTRFNVGDRVAIEPGVPCNTCEWCKLGKYNLCPEVQFLSTPPVKGAFVQYLKHREDFLFQIPDELSYEVATLAEPLSVGIHAFKRGRMEPGQTVFISGMGPVGLMAILAAKSFGAKHIIVSDLEPLRLETAKKLGATETINIMEEDLEFRLSEITNHLGVDLVIETSGNANALSSSIKYVKRGGNIVSIGFPAQDQVPLDITYMLQNEIDLYTVYRYTNTYPLAIRILESSIQTVQSIITDRYDLDDIQLAMDKVSNDRKNTLKVVVFPNNKGRVLK